LCVCLCVILTVVMFVVGESVDIVMVGKRAIELRSSTILACWRVSFR